MMGLLADLLIACFYHGLLAGNGGEFVIPKVHR